MGNGYRLALKSLYVGTIIGCFAISTQLNVHAGVMDGKEILTCNGSSTNTDENTQKTNCLSDTPMNVQLNTGGASTINDEKFDDIDIPATINGIADGQNLKLFFNLIKVTNDINDISILRNIISAPNSSLTKSYYNMVVESEIFSNLSSLGTNEYRSFVIKFHPSGTRGLDTGLTEDASNSYLLTEANSIRSQTSSSIGLRVKTAQDQLFNHSYNYRDYPQSIDFQNGLFYVPFIVYNKNMDNVFSVDDAGGKLRVYGIGRKRSQYGLNSAEVGLVVMPAVNPSRLRFVADSLNYRTGDMILDRVFVLPETLKPSGSTPPTKRYFDGIHFLGPDKNPDQYIESAGVAFGYTSNMPDFLMRNLRESSEVRDSTYIIMEYPMQIRQTRFTENLNLTPTYATERAFVWRTAIEFGDLAETSTVSFDIDITRRVLLGPNAVELHGNIHVDNTFHGLVTYGKGAYITNTLSTADTITVPIAWNLRLPTYHGKITSRGSKFVPFNMLTTNPDNVVIFTPNFANSSLVAMFSNIVYGFPATFTDNDIGVFLAINNHRLIYSDTAGNHAFEFTSQNNFPTFVISHFNTDLVHHYGAFLNIDFHKSFKYNRMDIRYPLTVVYVSANVVLDGLFNDDDNIIRFVTPANDSVLYYHGSIMNMQANFNPVTDDAPDILVSKDGDVVNDADGGALVTDRLDNQGLVAVVFHGDRQNRNIVDIRVSNFQNANFPNFVEATILNTKEFIGDVYLTARTGGSFTLHDTSFRGRLEFSSGYDIGPVAQVVNIGLKTNDAKDIRSVTWTMDDTNMITGFLPGQKMNIISNYEFNLVTHGNRVKLNNDMRDATYSGTNPDWNIISLEENSVFNIKIQPQFSDFTNTIVELPFIEMGNNSLLNVDHPYTAVLELRGKSDNSMAKVNTEVGSHVVIVKLHMGKNMKLNVRGDFDIFDWVDVDGGNFLQVHKDILMEIGDVDINPPSTNRNTFISSGNFTFLNTDNLNYSNVHAKNIHFKQGNVNVLDSSFSIDETFETIPGVFSNSKILAKNLTFSGNESNTYFRGLKNEIYVAEDLLVQHNLIFEDPAGTVDTDSQYGLKLTVLGDTRFSGYGKFNMNLSKFTSADQNIINLNKVFFTSLTQVTFPQYATIDIFSIENTDTTKSQLYFSAHSQANIKNDLILSDDSSIESTDTDLKVGGTLKSKTLTLHGGTVQAGTLDVWGYTLKNSVLADQTRTIAKADNFLVKDDLRFTNVQGSDATLEKHGVTIEADSMKFFDGARMTAGSSVFRDSAALQIIAKEIVLGETTGANLNMPDHSIIHAHHITANGGVEIKALKNSKLIVQSYIRSATGNSLDLTLLGASEAQILGKDLAITDNSFLGSGVYVQEGSNLLVRGSLDTQDLNVIGGDNPSTVNIAGNVRVKNNLKVTEGGDLTIGGDLILDSDSVLITETDSTLVVLGDVIIPPSTSDKNKFFSPPEYSESSPGRFYAAGDVRLRNKDAQTIRLGTYNHDFLVGRTLNVETLSQSPVTTSLPLRFYVRRFEHSSVTLQSPFVKPIHQDTDAEAMLSDQPASERYAQSDGLDDTAGPAFLLGSDLNLDAMHKFEIPSGGDFIVEDSYIDDTGALVVKHWDALTLNTIPTTTVRVNDLRVQALVLTPNVRFENRIADVSTLAFRFDLPTGSLDASRVYVNQAFPVISFDSLRFRVNQVIYENMSPNRSFLLSKTSVNGFPKGLEFVVPDAKAVGTMAEAMNRVSSKAINEFSNIMGVGAPVPVPAWALLGTATSRPLNLKGWSIAHIDRSDLMIDYSDEDEYWFDSSYTYPVVLHHLSGEENYSIFNMPSQSFMNRMHGIFAMFNAITDDSTTFKFKPHRFPLHTIYHKEAHLPWDRSQARLAVFGELRTVGKNIHALDIEIDKSDSSMVNMDGHVELLPISVLQSADSSILPHTFVGFDLDTKGDSVETTLYYVMPWLKSQDAFWTSWLDVQGRAVFTTSYVIGVGAENVVSSSNKHSGKVILTDYTPYPFTTADYEIKLNTDGITVLNSMALQRPLLMSIGMGNGLVLQNHELYLSNLNTQTLPSFVSLPQHISIPSHLKLTSSWESLAFDEVPSIIKSTAEVQIQTAKPWIVRADVSGLAPSYNVFVMNYSTDQQNMAADFSSQDYSSSWHMSTRNKNDLAAAGVTKIIEDRALIWRLYDYNKQDQGAYRLPMRWTLIRPALTSNVQITEDTLYKYYKTYRNHGFFELSGRLHNKTLFVDIGNIVFDKKYIEDDRFYVRPSLSYEPHRLTAHTSDLTPVLKDPSVHENLQEYFSHGSNQAIQPYILPWNEDAKSKLLDVARYNLLSGLQNPDISYIFYPGSLRPELIANNDQIVGDWFTDLFDDIGKWFENAFDDIADFFNNLGGAFGTDSGMLKDTFSRMKAYNNLLSSRLQHLETQISKIYQKPVTLNSYIFDRMNNPENLITGYSLIDIMIDYFVNQVDTESLNIYELDLMQNVVLAISHTMLGSKDVMQKEILAELVRQTDESAEKQQDQSLQSWKWKNYLSKLFSFDSQNRLQVDVANIQWDDSNTLQKAQNLENTLISSLVAYAESNMNRQKDLLQSMQAWKSWRKDNEITHSGGTDIVQLLSSEIDLYSSVTDTAKDLTFDFTGVGQFVLFNNFETQLKDSSVFISMVTSEADMTSSSDVADSNLREPFIAFIAEGPFYQVNQNADGENIYRTYLGPKTPKPKPMRFELLTVGEGGDHSPSVYFSSVSASSVFDAPLYIGSVTESQSHKTEIKLAGGKFNQIILHSGHPDLYLYLQTQTTTAAPTTSGQVFLSSYQDGNSNFIANIEKFDRVNNNQPINIGDGTDSYDLNFDVYGPEAMFIPRSAGFDASTGYNLDVTHRTKIVQHWPRSVVKAGSQWSFNSLTGDRVYINLMELDAQSDIDDGNGDIVVEAAGSIISRGSKYLKIDHDLDIDGSLLFVDDDMSRVNRDLLGEIKYLIKSLRIEDREGFYNKLAADTSEIMQNIRNAYDQYYMTKTADSVTVKDIYLYEAGYHYVQNQYLSEWLMDVKRMIGADTGANGILTMELSEYWQKLTDDFSIIPVSDFESLSTINLMEVNNLRLRRHGLMIANPNDQFLRFYETPRTSYEPLKETAVEAMQDCLIVSDTNDKCFPDLYKAVLSQPRRSVLRPFVVPLVIVNEDLVDENNEIYEPGIISVFVGSNIPEELIPDFSYKDENIYMGSDDRQHFLNMMTKNPDLQLPGGMIMFSLYDGSNNPSERFDVDENTGTADIIIPAQFRDRKILFAMYSNLFTVPDTEITDNTEEIISLMSVIKSDSLYDFNTQQPKFYVTVSDKGYYTNLFRGSIVRTGYAVTETGTLDITTIVDAESLNQALLNYWRDDFMEINWSKVNYSIENAAHHPFVINKNALYSGTQYVAYDTIFSRNAMISFSRLPQQYIENLKPVNLRRRTGHQEWLQLSEFRIDGNIDHRLQILNSVEHTDLIDKGWTFENPILARLPITSLTFYNGLDEDNHFATHVDSVLLRLNYEQFTNFNRNTICDKLADDFGESLDDCQQTMSELKITSSVVHPMSLYSFGPDVLFNAVAIPVQGEVDYLSSIGIYRLPILNLHQDPASMLNFAITGQVNSYAPIIFDFHGNAAQGIEADKDSGYVLWHINAGSVTSTDIVNAEEEEYSTYNYLYYNPVDDIDDILAQETFTTDSTAEDLGLKKIKFGSAVFNFEKGVYDFYGRSLRILNTGSITVQRSVRPSMDFSDALTNMAISLKGGGIFESTAPIQGGSIVTHGGAYIILHDTQDQYDTDILFVNPKYRRTVDANTLKSNSYLILDNINLQGNVFWNDDFTNLHVQSRGINVLQSAFVISNISLSMGNTFSLEFKPAAKDEIEGGLIRDEDSYTIWYPKSFTEGGYKYYTVGDPALIEPEDLAQLSDFYKWSMLNTGGQLTFGNGIDLVQGSGTEDIASNSYIMDTIKKETCRTLNTHGISGDSKKWNCGEVLIGSSSLTSTTPSSDVILMDHNLILAESGVWTNNVNIEVKDNASLRFGEEYHMRVKEKIKEVSSMEFRSGGNLMVESGGKIILSSNTRIYGLDRIEVKNGAQLIFDVHDTHIYSSLPDSVTAITVENLNNIIIRAHKSALEPEYIIPLLNLHESHFDDITEINKNIIVEIVNEDEHYPGIHLMAVAAMNGELFLTPDRQTGMINHINEPLAAKRNAMVAKGMQLQADDDVLYHNVYQGYRAIALKVFLNPHVFALPVLLVSYHNWTNMVGTESSYLSSIINNSAKHQTSSQVFNVWSHSYYSRKSLVESKYVPIIDVVDDPYMKVYGTTFGTHFKFDDHVRVGLSAGMTQSNGIAPLASGLFEDFRGRKYDLDISFKSNTVQFGGDLQYRDNFVHWLGVVGMYLTHNRYHRGALESHYSAFSSSSRDHAIMVHSRFGGSWDLTGKKVMWMPEIFFTISRIHSGYISESHSADPLFDDFALFSIDSHVNYISNFGAKLSFGKDLVFGNAIIKWNVYAQSDVVSYNSNEVNIKSSAGYYQIMNDDKTHAIIAAKDANITNPKDVGLEYTFLFGLNFDLVYNDVFSVGFGYSVGVDNNSRINSHNLNLSLDFVI